MSYSEYLINAALWLFMVGGAAGSVGGVAWGIERYDSGKVAWPMFSLAALSILTLTFCFATIAYRSQS